MFYVCKLCNTVWPCYISSDGSPVTDSQVIQCNSIKEMVQVVL